MLLQSKQLMNAGVLSLHTGRLVGNLQQPIIDPERLEIVGFWVNVQANPKEPLVLLAQDIRKLGGGRAMINSQDELTPAEDLLRLKDLLQVKFELINKVVRTESKKNLGKVEEYVVDAQTFIIQKLYVKQSLLKNFSMQNLVIDRQQIIEVTDNYITVSDASVTTPSLARQQINIVQPSP